MTWTSLRRIAALLYLVAGCATSPRPVTTPVLITPPEPVLPAVAASIPLPTAPAGRQGPGERYFDPQRTGVPLFDTRGHEETPLGHGFRAGDFARTGNVRFRYARIDVRLVECLGRIREGTGRPMQILSGYRSFEYNENIRRAGQGAAKSSFHISGSAADIVSDTPVEQFAIAVYLECGCNVGLGISPRFYHVDIRNNPVLPWGYQASRLAHARRVQSRVCGN